MTNLAEFNRTTVMLDRAIDNADKEDLAECARLLALNLAHYRLKYGDLPLENIEHLLTADVIDDETATLLTEGTLQCLVSLVQVTGKADIIYDGDAPASKH